MKRINSSDKLVEFLSGRRSGADTVVNVATIEFRFRAIVLIEKFVNLSDLVGFALTVTVRYKKETRVESSFSTAPAPS